MKPEGTTWRHARAKLDLSVEEAAAALDIAPGTLRNIEGNQPRANVSLRLAYRAAELYTLPLDELATNTGDGVPDNPPKQPKREPKTTPKRSSTERTTGPKRATDKAVA